MAGYFKNFPIITTTFDINGREETLNSRDILIRFGFKQFIEQNSPVVYPYQWRDGDRPDLIADFYYGSVDFFWLVYYSNNAFDMYMDFPLSQREFDLYIEDKYGSQQDAFNKILYFETLQDRLIIDQATFEALPEGEARSVSAFDHEFRVNEKKRNIKLIQNELALGLYEQLRRDLKQIAVLRDSVV